MDLKQCRAFFIDIDGTLVSQKNSVISERSKQIFLEAKKKGALLFINTARPAFMIPPNVFPRDIFDGVCSGCGTNIVFHGKTIYEHYIPEDVLYQLAKNLIAGRKSGNIHFEGVDTIYLYGDQNDWTRAYGFPDVFSAEDFLTKYKGAKIQKFATSGGAVIEPSALKECERWFNMMYHPHYTEGPMYGYDKGKAIKLTEEHLGLTHEFTVAIGDSVNDLEALTYAGTSVAMGNSEEQIKELCDFVTSNAWEDGVAEAVKRIMTTDSCSL